MCSYAQKKKLRYHDKNLQLSLVPGISNHGPDDGWYFNKFSFSLISGLSAGSKHFEFAGISNLSLLYTTGIQIAGFANVIGSNAFINLTVSEERDLIREEKFTSYFKGIQLAGFLNAVRDEATGLQLAGGFNYSGGSVLGIQIGGLGNIAVEQMQGVQLAGIYNVATASSGGMQVASLLNYTNGAMAGFQISLINRSFEMVGKRSSSPKNSLKSMHLGLVNMSKIMNGTQIGLINISKRMNGTQIGLINIFSTSPPKDSQKSGLPIGLINIGSKGGVFRVYNNELFLYNVEISTGNCSNCSATQYEMPMFSDYQKFNQNPISFSYNPNGLRDNKPVWSVGYGFERLLYRKYTMFPKKSGPQNKSYFLAWGVKFQHLNWTKEFDKALNLQTSIYGKAGRRVKFLGGSHYLYASVRLNNYLTESPNHSSNNKWMLIKTEGTTAINRIWPGYEVGIQF